MTENQFVSSFAAIFQKALQGVGFDEQGNPYMILEVNGVISTYPLTVEK